MSKSFRIRKGANIKLDGGAEKITTEAAFPASFAIKPSDFHGMIPKMMLKEGAEVKAGMPIFHDKNNEHLLFVSPVSGEIAEVIRGAKRVILEVRIIPDKEQKFVEHGASDPSAMSGDQVKATLLKSGLWPLIKQRPYDVVADPTRIPKAIFISGFDSSPLGPDYDFILTNSENSFQTGINALAKMTNGNVHLGLNPMAKSPLAGIKGVEINHFTGPHPSGNVGIQIHHVNPINKGEVVWTINPQSVVTIGKYFETGRVLFEKTIALVGSEVNKPRYVKTWVGASLKSIVEGEIKQGESRIISGNVLTGTKVNTDGYLGFYDDVVTVIPEGKEPQFLGWLMPNFNKFSFSMSYFSWLMPKKKYRLNTNMNGEDRPFVVSGQYEDYLPMDIYPVHLLKSILTNDIEKMENLGIYEIAPEDMALCEFACTSKIPVQKIIRDGLDLAIKELS